MLKAKLYRILTIIFMTKINHVIQRHSVLSRVSSDYQIDAQTFSFKASESDCSHMLALILFGPSDLPLALHTPVVWKTTQSESNHSSTAHLKITRTACFNLPAKFKRQCLDACQIQTIMGMVIQPNIATLILSQTLFLQRIYDTIHAHERCILKC